MPSNQWDPALYNQKHAYVFEYGRDLIALLNPQPGEGILDLGCGTGHLTNVIAQSGAQVVGIDSSASMIEAARAEYPEVEFMQADARDFSFPYHFDAIFSNAVLHWISDAESVAQSISRALRTGGRFVAEFGGKGNIAHIVNTLKTTLQELGHQYEDEQWYNPSIGEYSSLLERHGLEVVSARLFDRFTKLEEGERGLRNWIEMFRGGMLQGISDDLKEQLFLKMEEKLRSVLYRDGNWYADYRRLRIVAYKSKTLS